MNSVVTRSYSSSTAMRKSASAIRKEFLDYFRNDLGHTFIRSSPVVPLTDQTVSFVNAGMNQFKGIFLDYYDPPVTKVVNSQKCIRVGGKHNDLDIVGTDGYHHTMFEMLGNWSFGDYFKESACQYAWDLLTKHYGIKEEFLYVTYFGGNEKLGLKPDLECKDIWLRLGVPKERVLPFGIADNFWEMGATGPCGPCTEIHIDHTKQLINRAAYVNKGYSNLTELWNIVFVQYERLSDGSIVSLPKHHVDTGMGLERLVALLQEKDSNYDTDLFQPLFKIIQKYANAPEYRGRFGKDDHDGLDTGYRVLADHARMISIALADGMLPEDNQKLRRVIRKAIDVGETIFKKTGIVYELSCSVADNLGDVYSELQDNLKKVQKILLYEEDLFKKLRKSSGKEWESLIKGQPKLATISDPTAAGLVKGYKYLQTMFENAQGAKTLPGHVAFKLYDTHGLSIETIAELSEIQGLHFDEAAFEAELTKRRCQSRVGLQKNSEVGVKILSFLQNNRVLETDDSFKYQYTFDGNSYQFPEMKSKVVGAFIKGDPILNEEHKDIKEDILKAIAVSMDSQANDEIGIVLDSTLCYSAEGGQVSDKGTIRTKNLTFHIHVVEKLENYVIHFGKFASTDLKTLNGELKIGRECTVSIDPENRIGAMVHHTGIHLLNSAIKACAQTAYERSSAVSSNILKYQFHGYGDKLSLDQLNNLESLINTVIREKIPVRTKILNSLELCHEDSVTLLPGGTYAQTGIRVVDIKGNGFRSKEACCGTHVHNTEVLEHFCILNYIARGVSKQTVKAVLGPLAVSTKLAGENIQSRVMGLERKLNTENYTYESFKSMISQLENEIKNDNDTIIPYLVKENCLIKLRNLSATAWARVKEAEKSSIRMEIENAADSTSSFIVHCLQKSPSCLSLNEIVSLYPTTPTLIILRDKDVVKAQCCTPEKIVSNTFNAKIWIETVTPIFNAKSGTVKGFNAIFVSNMKSVNVPETSVEKLICEAITEAKDFVDTHMKSFEISSKAN